MTTFAYKDLVIDFTSSFQLMWDDQGSRGERDGAFWRPLINDPRLQNFYPVGDLAWPNRDDVNGKTAIAVVKDAKGDTGTALRQPLRFEQVWKDSGSGSYKDGSMWRPIPPDGYYALGLVCNSGYDPPSLDTIRCVRSDLVAPAYTGDSIWDDKGTNAWDNFSSWRINAPNAPEGEIYLSPGTFIGAASHTAPARDANAYALRLLMPEQAPDTPKPPYPVLRGYSAPADQVRKDSVTYAAILPWFTVDDPNLSPVEQIMKSPEYRLERVDRFKLIDFGYNQTEASERFEWAYEEGTDGSTTKEFSSTTGIEFGMTWKSGAWECSAKLSQSFTHSKSETEGWSQKTTRTIGVDVPPGKAVAAYTMKSKYTLFRKDGTQVTASRPEYEGVGGVYWTQYPPARTSPPKKPAAKPLPTKKPAAQALPAKKAVPAKSSNSR